MARFSPLAASNQVSSPSAMRPASGAIRPAIAASVVDLPEPDGPNRIVTPGGASTATSRAKPSLRATLMSTCRLDDTAPPGELIDRVQGHERDRSQHCDQTERLRILLGLDGIVDGQRRGLRFARNVPRHHERQSEVA